MKISELEEGRRKKKHKVKKALYGPGPFGMYGVDAGYSGATESRKFTDLELAIMEGGGSIDDDRTYNIKKQLEEKWSKKYKSSINCSNPKGFSQRAHCQSRKKNEEIEENFADGKKPGRKGLAKRSGVNCKASVSTLRNVAKNSSGEKQRMAHWCANMKSGKSKK